MPAYGQGFYNPPTWGHFYPRHFYVTLGIEVYQMAKQLLVVNHEEISSFNKD